MRDLASNIGVAVSLVPAVQSATLKGTAVDLRGFDSAAVVVTAGAVVGAGLYDVKVQDSDTTTDGDFADAPAGSLVGSLPAALAENGYYKVSYVGSKRYIRAVITKQSGTSIAAGALVIKGRPAQRPVA